MNSKKNVEFAVGYVQRIVEYSLGIRTKINLLDTNWNGLVNENVKACTLELSVTNAISEEKIYSIFKSK